METAWEIVGIRQSNNDRIEDKYIIEWIHQRHSQ